MAINEFEAFAPDTQKNKQAIYLGLISILSEQQAKEVLADWASYFSDKRSVFNGLNSFAREICQRFDKNDQQRQLVRELNRALLNKDNNQFQHLVKDELKRKTELNAGTDLNESEAFSSYVDVPISTPDFQTFQILLLEILDLVEMRHSATSAALRPFLNELIQSMPWSDGQQQQLIQLISTGATTQIRSYKTDQLKSFLKHIRRWIKDEIGEIEAEDLINEAIAEVHSMPAEASYAAKNFL